MQRRLLAFVAFMALAWFTSARAGEVQLISAADPSMVAPRVLGSGTGGRTSQDGRYVLFLSSAPNVVPGQIDPNGVTDVFLRDRVAGTTTLVSRSHASPVTTANRESQADSISADGRWVAFTSIASNLVPLPNGLPPFSVQVYLFDRTTGTMVLVSRTAGSSDASGGTSQLSVLSADGNYLAFTSTSTDLVAGQTDANGGPDVFLYDRAADAVTLVSRAASSATTAGNGRCGTGLALSADGRYVAFECEATNLVAGQSDANGETDVFLYDRVAGTTSLVSRSSASATTAAAASAGSGRHRISADGRYVSFSSNGTDLVAGQVDTNHTFDVFLFDRVAGSTVLVSRSSGNPLAAAEGSHHDISADGSYVAFTSDGTSLVPGQVDGTDTSDLFLFERATGAVTLVSHAAGSPSTAAGAWTTSPRISDDGAWIAFESSATDLVAGQTDTNGDTDVFLYDRAAGTARLASHTAGSAVTAAESRSFLSGLSGDGGTVVVTSASDDLATPDANGGYDGFVYDRGTQTVTALSFTDPVTGLTGDGASFSAMTSADGRWTVFSSTATNLVPGMVNANGSASDIFLYDRVTGTRTLISHAAGSPATSGNKPSSNASISADGRWVAFISQATDLVAGMTSFTSSSQAYLYERETGTITLVSRRNGSPTQGATGSSLDTPSLSADSRFVAWNTGAWDLIPGVTDNHGGYDVYLFDRVTGVITLVSRTSSSASTAGNGSSQSPWLSADGRYVTFSSSATDLVPGQTDTNGAGNDIFLYDRVTGSTSLVSRSASSPVTTGSSSSLRSYLSADGRYVLFGSTATDLVAGQVDTNGFGDLFLFDRETGTTTLVSHVSGSPVTTGNGFSGGLLPSADGRWLPFQSYATNLISGIVDTNGAPDLFLYDRSTGTSTLVSRSSGSPSATASGSSGFGLVSADGSRIGFYSTAPDLVPGQEDSNGTGDVFLYERATGHMTLVSRTLASPDRTGNSGSIPRWLSADGLTVSFTSNASDLTPDDFNGTDDVFLFTTSPGSFFTLPACRLLDTRQPQDGPALVSDVSAILSLHGICGIPATARAVAVNVTVTQPTGAGHLTLYTGDSSPPVASTINFSAGQTRANNAILSLATDGTGTLAARPGIAGGGTVHVILDVVGYFE